MSKFSGARDGEMIKSDEVILAAWKAANLDSQRSNFYYFKQGWLAGAAATADLVQHRIIAILTGDGDESEVDHGEG